MNDIVQISRPHVDNKVRVVKKKMTSSYLIHYRCIIKRQDQYLLGIFVLKDNGQLEIHMEASSQILYNIYEHDHFINPQRMEKTRKQ
jgi:hypothetical protein